VPFEESLGALIELRDEGKIAHIGLSNVSVAQLEQGLAMTEIVTVQNRYNLSDRASEDVLDACTERAIGFIPWFPLATGALAQPGGPLDEVAQAHDATPSQIALAWLLAHSPIMLPDPGHVEGRPPRGEHRRRAGAPRRRRGALARGRRALGRPNSSRELCMQAMHNSRRAVRSHATRELCIRPMPPR